MQNPAVAPLDHRQDHPTLERPARQPAAGGVTTLWKSAAFGSSSSHPHVQRQAGHRVREDEPAADVHAGPRLGVPAVLPQPDLDARRHRQPLAEGASEAFSRPASAVGLLAARAGPTARRP